MVRRKFNGFHIAIAGVLTVDVLSLSNELLTIVELDLGTGVLEVPV